MKNEPFWMIYGMEQGAPTVRHLSREVALKEASRLARSSPGVTFVVLAATDYVVKRDVDITPVEQWNDAEVVF